MAVVTCSSPDPPSSTDSPPRLPWWRPACSLGGAKPVSCPLPGPAVSPAGSLQGGRTLARGRPARQGPERAGENRGNVGEARPRRSADRPGRRRVDARIDGGHTRSEATSGRVDFRGEQKTGPGRRGRSLPCHVTAEGAAYRGTSRGPVDRLRVVSFSTEGETRSLNPVASTIQGGRPQPRY
jgi:hypothetical protein